MLHTKADTSHCPPGVRGFLEANHLIPRIEQAFCIFRYHTDMKILTPILMLSLHVNAGESPLMTKLTPVDSMI